MLVLLPLMAAFSEAALITGIDCSHCLKQSITKPDCCAVETVAIEEKCDLADTQTDPCPHGGFCQAGDTIPVVVTPLSTAEMHVDISLLSIR